jgi:hypothetical protein
MNQAELEAGVAELDSLARREYGVSLEQLLSGPDRGEKQFQRLSRLIGVTLKQPFADPIELEQPSPYTGALRAGSHPETPS